MIVKRRFDFLASLDDIARESNKKYPSQRDVGMEVVYRPHSITNVKAEVHIGNDKNDSLWLIFHKDGNIQNGDDPREFFNEEQLKERLLEVVDELMKASRSKEKLDFIRVELENLK